MFTAALWSPAGKGLTSWLLSVMLIVFAIFPCGILGQVWYLIVSFPDLCLLSYFGMGFDLLSIHPPFGSAHHYKELEVHKNDIRCKVSITMAEVGD